MTTDKEHLQWIHDRIVEVYGESENIDFLHRMRKIIDKQDTELNLHSVSHRLTKLNSKLELIEEILSRNGAVTRRRLEKIKDSIINEIQVEIKNSCG